ncbi:MAG: TolC family protein [Bacteroidota bacterium]
MANLKKYGPFLLLLLVWGKACPQSQIPANLVTLSELTLDRSPLIKRNELTIGQAEAGLRNQKSIFDYQLSSGLSLQQNEQTLFDADPRSPILMGDLEGRNTGISLALQKQFRTGLIAQVSSEYSRALDNFPFNAFNEEVGADVSDHLSSATVSLTQPLLRNNGKRVVTAFERAAKLEVKSAEENFALNTAFELLQLATAYWQYLAAYKSLDIFVENESRVRKVLDITKELVKADKRPESELLQIKADLVEQEQQTNLAAQNLYNARINLGRIIGLNEGESKQIGNPFEEFPTLEAFSQASFDLVEISELALKNRSDIVANENSLKALEAQRYAAKNATLPQLDLSAFYTRGGAAVGGGLENYLNAFGNRQGRNHTRGLRLNFTFPINNNRAKANLASNTIAVTDQEIALENLKRNIALNVSIAHNNLENSLFVVEKAKESLDFYQKVFSNEQIRFQNGMTTLLNLILFQERLTFAQLDFVNAQQQLATALTNLRFETGTLLSREGENRFSVERNNFLTLPKTR